MMAESNECPSCAHDLKNPEDESKEHTERGGVLICKVCYEVCKPLVSATPPPPVTPVQQTTQDIESMARAVATQVAKIRNEMIWKDLQRPGCIIRAVDGGWIVENRWGEEAVRVDLEDALTKIREFLTPPQ